MRHQILLIVLTVLLYGGCTSHLSFVEESHLAFKAQFRAQSAAPFLLDLGYRRGMIALIPLQSEGSRNEGQASGIPLISGSSETSGASEASGSSETVGSDTPATANESAEPTTKILRIQHDPDELMSLYSTFKANIGFNDPVKVCHFLATGVSATTLLSDKEALKALAEAIGTCEELKGGRQ